MRLLTLTNATLLTAFAVGAFMSGALMVEDVRLRERNAIAQDRDALNVILAECNYSPHPISDVSWELYRQRFIPLGTAGYYTGMVKSVNGPAAECLQEILPEQWAAPGGS